MIEQLETWLYICIIFLPKRRSNILWIFLSFFSSFLVLLLIRGEVSWFIQYIIRCFNKIKYFSGSVIRLHEFFLPKFPPFQDILRCWKNIFSGLVMFLSGLRTKIAVLVFAASWSAVDGWGGAGSESEFNVSSGLLFSPFSWFRVGADFGSKWRKSQLTSWAELGQTQIGLN